MSFLRSLFAGVSGLRSHQVMMDVLGNNISNVNTIGFKSGRVTFGELFAQTLRGATQPTLGVNGGTNPMQIGLGTSVNSLDTMFSQGGIENTGQRTDLAIQGPGFFAVKKNGQTLYTRVGTFQFDSNGTLVNPGNGAILQGKLADIQGNIPSGIPLEDLTIPLDRKSPPNATTRVRFGGNLDAAPANANINIKGKFDPNEPVGTAVSVDATVMDSFGQSHIVTLEFSKTSATTWDMVAQSATNATISGGTATLTFDPLNGNLTGVTPLVPLTLLSTLTPPAPAMVIDPTFEGLAQTAGSTSLASNFTPAKEPVGSSVAVFDSLGNQHTLTVTFTKDPLVPNLWSWSVSVPPPATITGGAGGTVTFAADGTLAGVTYNGGASAIGINPGNGATAMSINLDLGTPGNTSGLTQNRGTSSVVPREQDGYGIGELSDIFIDTTGLVTGSFSNGKKLNLAQIMMAEFNNPAGLTRVGDNLYDATGNSGIAALVSPGGTSRSVIVQGALEQSNVDLSEEFTRMILAQRGFQANARVITTSDEFLTEVVNLKR